jgi:hypothetical protein
MSTLRSTMMMAVVGDISFKENEPSGGGGEILKKEKINDRQLQKRSQTDLEFLPLTSSL